MRAGCSGIVGYFGECGEQAASLAPRQVTESTGLFPAFKPHFSFRRTEWWRRQSSEKRPPELSFGEGALGAIKRQAPDRLQRALS